jgi:hypothetical protein
VNWLSPSPSSRSSPSIIVADYASGETTRAIDLLILAPTGLIQLSKKILPARLPGCALGDQWAACGREGRGGPPPRLARAETSFPVGSGAGSWCWVGRWAGPAPFRSKQRPSCTSSQLARGRSDALSTKGAAYEGAYFAFRFRIRR